MSESPAQPKSLSEISHLFLSGVREKQTQGVPRPTRLSPQQLSARSSESAAEDALRSAAVSSDVSIDLTPEEFAEVFGAIEPAHSASRNGISSPDRAPIGPVRAVIASHLGPQQLEYVQQYAAHLCPAGKRLGLICADASELRLSIFEHNPHPLPADEQIKESLDARRMTEALDELAWDVDFWLLLLPTPRAAEARSLLREINHWSVLMQCDHEGAVACYRTLKGLSDLHRPRLSLAMLDAPGDAEADSAFERLANVCQQFLNWPLESEPTPAADSQVAEHVVFWSCGTRDKAQLATAPQWKVLSDFLARAKKNAAARPTQQNNAPLADPIPFPKPAAPEINNHPSAIAMENAPSAQTIPAQPEFADAQDAEVIDLPDTGGSPTSIIAAILRGGRDLVESPVKAPMCPDASIAVSRDHRLVLVAVAKAGLIDLGQIGKAYQWLVDNRALVAMAIPQFAIDAMQLPRLNLLVNHADLSADVLSPIMQSASVTVSAYRKLRWAGKTGLLLEAA